MFIEKIIQGIHGQQGLITKLLGDITEEQMITQVGTFENHPAWQIGHLANTTNFLASQIGGVEYVSSDKYGMGSVPTTNRADYPSKEELLADLAKGHELIFELLGKLTKEDLNAETKDEGFRQMAPTVADAILFIGVSHEQMHVGQIMAWRKAMGLGGALFAAPEAEQAAAE